MENSNAQVGDLVMWVDSWRNLAYGKVIGFDGTGRPIAREITCGGMKYKRGHIVSWNYFIIQYGKGTDMCRTVVEESPIEKARRQFNELEGLTPDWW